MSKSIRIKDIAQLAGVSVGTVDRVLHNRGQVSKDSYDKVMEILEKTGYTPNLIARTLGSNKTHHIAALLPDPAQDEYWKFSNEGVQQAFEEWGQYGVKVEPSYFDLYDKNSFLQVAEKVLESKPDGLLTAPIFYNEAAHLFNLCQANQIPYVVFNNNIPQSAPITFIGQNLHQSGRVAAELLHMNQHEGTFAILHIYDDIHSSLHLYEKEKGFKEYFEEQHEKFEVVSVDLSNTHEPTLEKELKELLSRPKLKGVFVTTSKGVSAVSAAMEKYGKNNVRLVAYDLLKENRQYLKKGIIDFLINQNSKRQAFLGVTQLANHLLFNKKMQPTYLFPLEIISRQNLDSFLNSGFH